MFKKLTGKEVLDYANDIASTFSYEEWKLINKALRSLLNKTTFSIVDKDHEEAHESARRFMNKFGPKNMKSIMDFLDSTYSEE